MEARRAPEGVGEAQDEVASSARLETFADGVFAIAITLLVLEIHIPSASEPVWATLQHQWPSFLATSPAS